MDGQEQKGTPQAFQGIYGGGGGGGLGGEYLGVGSTGSRIGDKTASAGQTQIPLNIHSNTTSEIVHSTLESRPAIICVNSRPPSILLFYLFIANSFSNMVIGPFLDQFLMRETIPSFVDHKMNLSKRRDHFIPHWPLGRFWPQKVKRIGKRDKKTRLGNWPSMNVENGQSENGELKWTRKMANWKRKVGENERKGTMNWSKFEEINNKQWQMQMNGKLIDWHKLEHQLGIAIHPMNILPSMIALDWIFDWSSTFHETTIGHIFTHPLAIQFCHRPFSNSFTNS